jgi:hypothetical protein
MLRRCLGAAVCLAAVLTTGCGEAPPTIVEAEGIVLVNGRPLPRARVRLIPSIPQSSDYIAQGMTDDEGRFTLTCHGQDGACTGENLVVLTEDFPEELTRTSARAQLKAYRDALKNRPIPPATTNLADTPLRVTVTAEQREYKIEARR